MIAALLVRVESLVGNDSDLHRLEQLGLVEDGKFLYLKWNPNTRSHEKTDRDQHCPGEGIPRPDQAEPPLPEGHPAVPCATPADRNHDGGHRSFHLELHKRYQEAHLTYIAMERLSFNAVWHLVGATVCPSKLGIGPLERSCQEDLSNLTDRQVTSLVLGNSSHFCYGNSLIHAYLWTCATGCHASLPA